MGTVRLPVRRLSVLWLGAMRRRIENQAQSRTDTKQRTEKGGHENGEDPISNWTRHATAMVSHNAMRKVPNDIPVEFGRHINDYGYQILGRPRGDCPWSQWAVRSRHF